ncbi:HAD family hydrolase [Nocardioides sp. NPDC006303]|uniref:HAD family hydrolase n=1 Tax=Nocardioides sp. NPDC006303 TaxID=3156747 RepID=UPI0033A2FB47
MSATTAIFDLFGTLVAAPSRSDRAAAVHALSAVTESSTAAVDAYLDESWMTRHDGSLPDVDSLVDDLMKHLCSSASPSRVAAMWRSLATPRVVPDRSVSALLTDLRANGIRIGLISDASAEIAEAWLPGRLAQEVNHAVFSCTSGALKPSAVLYREALERLDARPEEALYVGDGGGDELRGAQEVGMTPVRVARRGGANTLAYGVGPMWDGLTLSSVEEISPERLVRLGEHPLATVHAGSGRPVYR